MKRLRTRVRLTACDWRRIYNALCYLREWNEDGEINGTPPTARDCLIVLRKIGLEGMAARGRGVAPAASGRYAAHSRSRRRRT